MPMIDIYATAGTFADPHKLAADAAATVKAVEQVPDIPMFRKNTAGFVHHLPVGAMANVDGDESYVRVEVLTNAGALDRDKQLAVVKQLTELVAIAAGDDSLCGATRIPTTNWLVPRRPRLRRSIADIDDCRALQTQSLSRPSTDFSPQVAAFSAPSEGLSSAIGCFPWQLR